MRHLLSVLSLIFRADRTAFLVGLFLMIATLAAGVALLGLAGWFIAAAGLAGLAGAGAAFNYFTPGAVVRFLAIVRAAARYGERVTTHDATLRFLADIRVRLFRGIAARPFPVIERLRSAVALNRITTDIDALDTVYLRIAAPALSAVVVLAGAFALLWWLVSLPVAAAVTLLLGLVGAGVFALGLRRGEKASVRRALALEAVRVRMIDLSQGAADLAFAGRLDRQRAAIAEADGRAVEAHRRLDALDRWSGAAITVAVSGAVAAALLVAALTGLPVTLAALAALAAFALGEAIQPMRRAALEVGRAKLAARRAVPTVRAAPAPEPAAEAPPQWREGLPLAFEDVSFARGPDRDPVIAGFSLAAGPGEWVALVGPSGCGKSTALALAARLLQPTGGTIRLGGADLAAIPERALRADVALLPQRSELFAGTVADNLRLAAPDAGEDELSYVLAVAGLEEAVERVGGLSARLGEGGGGLSGGETRRLALARLLLRRPAVVLLDEPTEGLDDPTAERVLAALRRHLSRATVIAASHRAAEREVADRIVRLGPPFPDMPWRVPGCDDPHARDHGGLIRVNAARSA